MTSSIKIRATLNDGVTTVKALMVHPMETGLRRDSETDELIPAHFIEEVTAEYEGKVVFKAYISGGISKNPFLSFKIKNGNVGKIIKINWKDNNGEIGLGEAIIKGK